VIHRAFLLDGRRLFPGFALKNLMASGSSLVFAFLPFLLIDLFSPELVWRWG
jgi:hypothetical protein